MPSSFHFHRFFRMQPRRHSGLIHRREPCPFSPRVSVYEIRRDPSIELKNGEHGLGYFTPLKGSAICRPEFLCPLVDLQWNLIPNRVYTNSLEATNESIILGSHDVKRVLDNVPRVFDTINQFPASAGG